VLLCDWACKKQGIWAQTTFCKTTGHFLISPDTEYFNSVTCNKGHGHQQKKLRVMKVWISSQILCAHMYHYKQLYIWSQWKTTILRKLMWLKFGESTGVLKPHCKEISSIHQIHDLSNFRSLHNFFNNRIFFVVPRFCLMPTTLSTIFKNNASPPYHWPLVCGYFYRTSSRYGWPSITLSWQGCCSSGHCWWWDGSYASTTHWCLQGNNIFIVGTHKLHSTYVES